MTWGDLQPGFTHFVITGLLEHFIFKDFHMLGTPYIPLPHTYFMLCSFSEKDLEL